MNNRDTLIVILSVVLLIWNNSVYSQAGSVELQDGGGIFISSHSSIEAAYGAIPDTITGAYIIEILEPYTGASEMFPIDLTLKTGHSALNTITIRPDAGNTAELISSSNTNGIINIIDADYIIIDGRPGGTGSAIDLIIHNTAVTGSGSNTIELESGATNCVIKYCNLINNISSTAGPRVVIFGPSASNPTGNSNNLVENCILDGSRSGVASSGTTANPNTDNKLSNCSIINWTFAGVWWLGGTKSLTIEGCTIRGSGNSSNSTVYGIIAAPSIDESTLTIKKNKIVDLTGASTSTSLAIRGISISAPGTGSVLNIENNFISITANNNNASITFGIYTAGTTEPYTLNINYNTILIGGTQTGGIAGRLVSAGIVKQSTAPGVVYTQRNNICINTRTGGTAGVIHAGNAFNATNGILNIDYNCYFATGSSDGINSYPATWDSVGFETADGYKIAAAPQEQNIRFKNVTFVSNNDLHLAGGSIGDPDLSGRPIAGITTDIDGDTRNANYPYKGADESTAFTLKKLNATLNLEACSPTPDTITVLLRSASSPYDVVDSAIGVLNSNGDISLEYVKPLDGVNYYVVVKHRNSIETWSKSGGEMFTAGSLTYDFTTSASQAYEDNQVLVGSNYSVYTGDVNQDGIVDLTDIVIISNDANAFVTGYVISDLNCNEIVDLADLLYAFNNSSLFVSVKRP